LLTVDEIISELRHESDPRRVAALKRVGAASPALGVGLPTLRSLAKRIGHDHRLALALWQTPCREARILASLIDEPERVTANQMDRWAESFGSWEICDQVCQNLFARTPLAPAKAVEWTRRSEEFVKRAAFVLVAVRAVRDKRTDDSAFADVIPTVMAAADDDRPYVRKEPAGRSGRSASEATCYERTSSTPSCHASTATAGARAGSPATYRRSSSSPGAANRLPARHATVGMFYAQTRPWRLAPTGLLALRYRLRAPCDRSECAAGARPGL
jgi:3-methyladenine DNA glycosylase AlkD